MHKMNGFLVRARGVLDTATSVSRVIDGAAFNVYCITLLLALSSLQQRHLASGP